MRIDRLQTGGEKRPPDWLLVLNFPKSQTGPIAIVDDDEPLCEALGSLLKAAGFAADTFHSAEAFLGSPDWQTTRVLVLDVRLPGMSGIELQRQIHSLDGHIPIVFMTAHGDASLRDILLKAGASAFLNKPVRREALVTAIRAALDTKVAG